MTTHGIVPDDVREAFARGAIAAGYREPGSNEIEAFHSDGSHWFTLDLENLRDLEDVVYFIGGDTGAIKIGFTTDISARLKAIQAYSPIPLRVLASVEGDRHDERLYHATFGFHRLHGEWFERCPEIEAEIAALNKLAPPDWRRTRPDQTALEVRYGLR